jgi:hypothetical protein
VQAGFGLMIGLWTPDAAGHAPVIAYRAAFAVLVLVQLPGLVGFVLRRRREHLAKAAAVEEEGLVVPS